MAADKDDAGSISAERLARATAKSAPTGQPQRQRPRYVQAPRSPDGSVRVATRVRPR